MPLKIKIVFPLLMTIGLCVSHLSYASSSLKTSQTAPPPIAISLIYEESPIYIRKQGEKVVGIFVNYANALSKKSGISFAWYRGNLWDRLGAVGNMRPNVCSIALAKTDDRLAIMKFTEKISETNGYVIVAKRNRPSIMEYSTLEALLGYAHLRTVHKKYYVVSPEIKATFNRHNVPEMQLNNPRLVKMLMNDQIDFYVTTLPASVELIDTPEGRDTLKTYNHLTDIKQPTRYYIGCSKTTSDSLISRLNDAIKQLPLIPAE